MWTAGPGGDSNVNARQGGGSIVHGAAESSRRAAGRYSRDMFYGHRHARSLSRLIQLLRLPGSTAGEVRDALRVAGVQARECTVTLHVLDGRLTIDDTALPSDDPELADLADRLRAHAIARLVVRQHAAQAELLKCARLLADAPSPDAQDFERRLQQCRLWHIALTRADSPQEAVADEEPTPPYAGQATIAGHLARVRAATDAAAAAVALEALVDVAVQSVGAGAAVPLADVLVGVVRAEAEVESPVVRSVCTRTIERLQTPAVTRLVAQLLPTLGARPGAYRAILEAIGRCGDAGAAALIAHLMAAESMDERRTFFEAIVRLDVGTPMLIDALGHPQWFVVRNAACLLGEMGATSADRALARLLDHRDARVREAAAGALARLQTPTARLSLQRMLQDVSPAVRQHAATAFSGEAKVARPLVAALDAEQDGDVQLSILAALGRLGTPDAVQKLERAALSSSLRPMAPIFRIAALEALTVARGPDSLPTLRSLLSDAEPVVRSSAERLIAMLALRG